MSSTEDRCSMDAVSQEQARHCGTRRDVALIKAKALQLHRLSRCQAVRDEERLLDLGPG